MRGKERLSSDKLQEGLKAITPKSAKNSAKRRMSVHTLTRRYLPGIGTRFCKVKSGVVVRVLEAGLEQGPREAPPLGRQVLLLE